MPRSPMRYPVRVKSFMMRLMIWRSKACSSSMPGALADHLTSSGGMLTDSGQMSALRWLEAGATGSYGTVIEP